MNIRQTNLSNPQAYRPSTQPPISEQKAPAGDSFSFSRRLDSHDVKDIVGFTAMGAIGGALGGNFGGGAVTTTLLTGVTSAAVDTAGAFIDSEITQDPWGGLNVALSPMIGGGAGLVGGLLGVGLNSISGMGPAMSGAVAGGATHFALAAWGAYGS